MQHPRPNPCQSSRNRSNSSRAGTSSSIASASSPSCPTAESDGSLVSATSETGQTTAVSGSETVVESTTTIGGAHSLIGRIFSGQSPTTITTATSHYRTPDNKFLSSDSTSSVISTSFNNTAIALSPTTLSMLPVPSSSITLSSYPALSTSSSTTLSPPCSLSSVPLASSSSSESSSCSLPSTSSFFSTLPSELSSSDWFTQPGVISHERYQDHLDKEPFLLSELSSKRLLLRQRRDQQGGLTSQAENNTSPDQQRPPLLQSQHQHHLQPYTVNEQSPPQEPSHHPGSADCQSHLSSCSSPRPQPIRRRSPVRCPPPPVIFPSISGSIISTSPSCSSSSLTSSPSDSSNSLSSPPLSCSAYSYLSNPSPSSSLTSSTATDTDSLLQYTLSSPSPSSTAAPHIITSNPISIHVSLQLLRLEQPQSALSPSLGSLPFCGSPSSSGVLSTNFTAESTTSTSLSCAYSQPFLSVASLDIPRSVTTHHQRRTSISLLHTLDSLSPQPPSLNTMTRQRSRSASSAQQLTAAKAPRSPTASLATTAAMYDPQQPPKTPQDILLLAQSHYISHRYVQALSLYKLAAEHHHSLPACSSLYALYTSNQTGSGLVRSDTKAALILIHALRIWTARRWSTTRIESTGSMRSRTQDDHDELEEYFAHPRKPTRQQNRQHKQQQRRSLSTGATASFRPNKEQPMADPDNKNALAQSMESEYRHPQFLNWRDEAAAAEIHTESGGSEGESESSEEDDSDAEYEGDQADLDTDQEVSDHADDGDDEEQEKEEEARRIGLATGEIEDIIQKICHMIQKGVLGLDEPVLVEAVSMLRKIERGLHQEAEAIKAERARFVSLFTSSLSGGPSDEAASRPALLLTQGVDLSFLNLGSPDEDGSNHLIQAQAQPMGRSIRQRPDRKFTSPTPLFKHLPMNASIAKLSTKEQEIDHLFACAIRIRVMFTLGWVHQQKGEYHYGAQAYGVCSEIPATGKRPLDSLQHQANVQRWTCKAFEHKTQEQAEATKRRAVEAEHEEDSASHVAVAPTGAATPTPIEGKKKKNVPATRSPPSRNTIGSSASSIFTSSQPSTGGSRRHHRPDISSPSSLSSSESESASTSIHGRSSSASAVSSFSAAIWSSGLFKSNSKTSATSPPSKVSAGQKIQTVLDPPVTIETKDRRHRGRTSKSESNKQHKQQHQKHQHKQQQQQQAGTGIRGLPTLRMTMAGHQNQIVKCGHCGQRRALMPLCVCKKVRYCNLECRLAHLETHRSTCSGLVSSASSSNSHVVSPSSALGIVDPNFSVGPVGVAL